mgnify:FL=1
MEVQAVENVLKHNIFAVPVKQDAWMASAQTYVRLSIGLLRQCAVVAVTEVWDRRAKPGRLCYPCLPVPAMCPW